MKKGASIILFLLLSISVNAQSNYIPKLTPVDVYGNFEEIGFNIEKDLGSKYGNFWTAKNNSGLVKYNVEINSDNVNKVESIRATARNVNYNNNEAKQFLKYTASVLALYGTASKSQLNRWININYNSSESNTTFGTVKVKLMAPSETVRILKISTR